MRLRWKNSLCLAVLVVLMTSAVRAEIKLPALFGDNMVLQCDEPVAVWGKVEPGETVTVTMGDREASARADAKGHWKAMVPKLTPGGPMEMTVAGSSGEKVTIKNVLLQNRMGVRGRRRPLAGGSCGCKYRLLFRRFPGLRRPGPSSPSPP